MTEKVRYGSEIEVETDDAEFKGYLDSVDVSFEYDDEIDAVHYGNSTINTEDFSIGYQSQRRELIIDELQQISGVGRRKAEALYREGYRHIDKVRIASQSELSEIDEIGNALAARIKADVGDYELSDDSDIDAEEIIRELNGKKEGTSFLEEETLVVNIHE